MFVVIGASGRTGSAVVESLLAEGRPLRVMVRSNPERWIGRAEVTVGDLRDPDALAGALSGADGAYLLLPDAPGEPRFAAYQDAIAGAIAGAVERSGVPHVVFQSAIGASLATGAGPASGLHRAEQRLRRVRGTAFTFLRAAAFMEYLGMSLATLDQGFVASFLPPELEIDMVSTRDVGALAAALLAEGATESRIVQIGGARVSTNDVAAALTRLTGKTVRAHRAPLDAVVPVFTGIGASEDFALHVRELYDAQVRGRVRFDDESVRIVGRTTLDEVLIRLLEGR